MVPARQAGWLPSTSPGSRTWLVRRWPTFPAWPRPVNRCRNTRLRPRWSTPVAVLFTRWCHRASLTTGNGAAQNAGESARTLLIDTCRLAAQYRLHEGRGALHLHAIGGLSFGSVFFLGLSSGF